MPSPKKPEKGSFPSEPNQDITGIGPMSLLRRFPSIFNYDLNSATRYAEILKATSLFLIHQHDSYRLPNNSILFDINHIYSPRLGVELLSDQEFYYSKKLLPKYTRVTPPERILPEDAIVVVEENRGFYIVGPDSFISRTYFNHGLFPIDPQDPKSENIWILSSIPTKGFNLSE